MRMNSTLRRLSRTPARGCEGVSRGATGWYVQVRGFLSKESIVSAILSQLHAS